MYSYVCIYICMYMQGGADALAGAARFTLDWFSACGVRHPSI